MSGTAFMSVVVINKMEKRGGAETPLVEQKIINVADIREISEGRSLHDAGMGRDFETAFILLMDGTEYEVDATIPLMEKSLYEIGSFIKVDPLLNEEVDENQTSHIGKNEGDEGFESLSTSKEDENGDGEGGTAVAQIPRTETRRSHRKGGNKTE